MPQRAKKPTDILERSILPENEVSLSFGWAATGFVSAAIGLVTGTH